MSGQDILMVINGTTLFLLYNRLVQILANNPK